MSKRKFYGSENSMYDNVHVLNTHVIDNEYNPDVETINKSMYANLTRQRNDLERTNKSLSECYSQAKEARSIEGEKLINSYNELNDRLCEIHDNFITESQNNSYMNNQKKDDDVDFTKFINFNSYKYIVHDIVPVFKYVRSLNDYADLVDVQSNENKRILKDIYPILVNVNKMQNSLLIDLEKMKNEITQSSILFEQNYGLINIVDNSTNQDDVDLDKFANSKNFDPSNIGHFMFQMWILMRKGMPNFEKKKIEFIEQMRQTAEKDNIMLSSEDDNKLKFVEQLTQQQATLITHLYLRFPSLKNLAKEAQNILVSKTIITNLKSFLFLENINERQDKSVEDCLTDFLQNYCISNASTDISSWFNYNHEFVPDTNSLNSKLQLDMDEIENIDEYEQKIGKACGEVGIGGASDTIYRQNEFYNKRIEQFFQPFIFFVPKPEEGILFQDAIGSFYKKQFSPHNYTTPMDFVASLESFNDIWVHINAFFGLDFNSNREFAQYEQMKTILINSTFLDTIDKVICLWYTIHDRTFITRPEPNSDDPNDLNHSYENLIREKSKLLFPFKTTFRDHAMLMHLIFSPKATHKFAEARYGEDVEISDILRFVPLNNIVLQPHYLMLVMWIFGIIANTSKTTFLRDRLKRGDYTDEFIMMIQYMIVRIMDFVFSLLRVNELKYDMFDSIKSAEVNQLLSQSGSSTCKNANDFITISKNIIPYITLYQQSMNINVHFASPDSPSDCYIEGHAMIQMITRLILSRNYVQRVFDSQYENEIEYKSLSFIVLSLYRFGSERVDRDTKLCSTNRDFQSLSAKGDNVESSFANTVNQLLGRGSMFEENKTQIEPNINYSYVSDKKISSVEFMLVHFFGSLDKLCFFTIFDINDLCKTFPNIKQLYKCINEQFYKLKCGFFENFFKPNTTPSNHVAYTTKVLALNHSSDSELVKILKNEKSVQYISNTQLVLSKLDLLLHSNIYVAIPPNKLEDVAKNYYTVDFQAPTGNCCIYKNLVPIKDVKKIVTRNKNTSGLIFPRMFLSQINDFVEELEEHSPPSIDDELQLPTVSDQVIIVCNNSNLLDKLNENVRNKFFCPQIVDLMLRCDCPHRQIYKIKSGELIGGKGGAFFDEHRTASFCNARIDDFNQNSCSQLPDFEHRKNITIKLCGESYSLPLSKFDYENFIRTRRLPSDRYVQNLFSQLKRVDAEGKELINDIYDRNNQLDITKLNMAVNEERLKFSINATQIQTMTTEIVALLDTTLTRIDSILDLMLFSNMSMQMFLTCPSNFVWNSKINLQYSKTDFGYNILTQNDLLNEISAKFLKPNKLIVNIDSFINEILNNKDSFLASWLNEVESNSYMSRVKSLLHLILTQTAGHHQRSGVTPSIFRPIHISKRIQYFYPYILTLFIYNFCSKTF